MKNFDFNEAKAEREGKITPKSLLESALQHAGDKEQIVIVSVDKDGFVKTGWTGGGLLRSLGLLEAAKSQIIDDMTD